MKVSEKRWIRFRIYLVAFFFLGGLGVVLARAYQLQVLERDRLASIALADYRDIVKLPPKRGTIYDRKGHELAVSVEVGSIYAHPNQVERKANVALELSRILSADRRKILSLLESGRPFVWIERKIAPDKIREVKALGIEGVGVTTETRRFYPAREIAGHLLGFAGADNQGLEGLEKTYDGVLRGPEYTLVQMRDALGRPFFVSRPTTDGHEMHDLVLTIDKDIQYKAQQVLGRAVEETRAKSGHAIILNPETGEILAMAVVPQFNPNVFRQYQPYQWRNRAITDCYEPGSTLKAFLLAAALDKGIVSPQTRFYCEEGEYKVGGHTIHDHGDEGHGSLTVAEIVTFSSNIGAVKIGQKVGYETFYDYLGRFGYGSKTAIDLIGEREGFIRPPKEAREIDKATLYFGQGMTTSSIQLVTAVAAIANGGKLMRPFVVKEVRDQKGRVVRETRPQVVRRVLREETAKRVSQVLEGVVGEKGTGSLAAIEGYRVAGKTGTSQKVDPKTKKYSNKHYVTLFVGFVPAEDPKLVMLIVVDEPETKKYGGLAAGPVFREVGAWTLSHLRVNPQIIVVRQEEKEGRVFPVNRPANLQPKVSQEGPDRLPDFSGRPMREVLRWGRSLGVRVALEGTGFAVAQDPGPGASLKEISKVRVSFSPPT